MREITRTFAPAAIGAEDTASHSASPTTTLPGTSAEGKAIETIARPLYTDGNYTLVEVELVTGRSHQIRAHLKDAGYPLIGDAKYGDRRRNAQIADRTGLTTQLLHAGRLVFNGLPEPLAYLNGRQAEAPLPPQWAFIQKELFGKEIL